LEPPLEQPSLPDNERIRRGEEIAHTSDPTPRRQCVSNDSATSLAPSRPGRNARAEYSSHTPHGWPSIRKRTHLLSVSVLGGEQLPVPLGDDFGGAVGHFEGGLIVNRIRRMWDPGRPSFCLGHGIARHFLVSQ